MNEDQEKTHLIVVGKWSGSFQGSTLWHMVHLLDSPFFIERMEDETKSLFTHGALPVNEGVGSLYSQYEWDRRKYNWM